jgi:hypothetical protein
MGMAVAGNDDGLATGSIAHAAKATGRILMGDIIGFENVKSLFQIHTSTECLVSSTCEHSAS